MKRLIMICEGETEQAFANTILQPHFLGQDIILQAPLIKRSRGGIVKWEHLKSEIEMYLKSEAGVYVTTFIDYYGVQSKHGFPQWDSLNTISDKAIRMQRLENAMWNNIDVSVRHRFISNLQLHEFEGLLFNDINIIYSQIPSEDIVGKSELIKTLSDYPNPEMINDARETCPSNRLKRIIKGYNKTVHGSILADAIGLSRIRGKSPRFNNWITRLESI